MSARSSLRYIARQANLPPVVRSAGRFILDPVARKDACRNSIFYARLKAGRVPALTEPLPPGHARGKAIVASIGYAAVLTELGILRCLQMAGFETVVLGTRERWPHRFARALGHAFIDWADHLPQEGPALPLPDQAADLLALEHRDVRVGRFAAATALRNLRAGELNLMRPAHRAEAGARLSRAGSYAEAAHALLDDVKPNLGLFVDRGYTPQGELFDACLARGIPAVTWNAGHRSNTLVFKRYGLATRDEHPSSLSAATWARVSSMAWTRRHEARLQAELEGTYAAGDWYSEAGTQFGKRPMKAAEVRALLGVPTGRKVAVIFPHIVWDGTFFWGTDLFGSYERWLVETVQAVSKNPNVQWLVKIHPANAAKDARDGVSGMPADERCVRDALGTLPDHVRLVPADTPLSTFSLYQVMDYAITVRGTVGIEAAALGIPVLTAGTGRYDGHGFTIDHATAPAYLANLQRIQDVPPLSREQTLLARRYAYAVFVLRALPLQAMALEFRRDRTASIQPGFRAEGWEEWQTSPDVRTIVEWLSDRDEDLLVGESDINEAHSGRSVAMTAPGGPGPT